MKLLDELLFRFQKSGKLFTIVDLVSVFPDGKITKHKRWHGKSLLGNFLQLLYTQYSKGNVTNYALGSFNGSTNNNTTKATSGYQANSLSSCMYIDPAVGNANFGIQFGTGTTPVTALDYKVETLIPNGIDAGQFSYQQQGAIQAPQNDGLVTTFILQRIAVNNSGGTITVNEVTLVGDCGAYFCIFRELVSGGQIVLDTQSITCQITFQVTT